jgi:hypothetical protein
MILISVLGCSPPSSSSCDTIDWRPNISFSSYFPWLSSTNTRQFMPPSVYRCFSSTSFFCNNQSCETSLPLYNYSGYLVQFLRNSCYLMYLGAIILVFSLLLLQYFELLHLPLPTSSDVLLSAMKTFSLLDDEKHSSMRHVLSLHEAHKIRLLRVDLGTGARKGPFQCWLHAYLRVFWYWRPLRKLSMVKRE